MKEYPILFSSEMVKAILAGRKTQTRRVIKPQYKMVGSCHFSPTGYAEYEKFVTPNGTVDSCTCKPVKNFYGWTGDHLWVRETWRPYGWGEDPILIQYKADMAKVSERGLEFDPPGYDDWYERIFMECSDQCESADCKMVDENYTWDSEEECLIKWKPSIFLPRWASRITLEIVDVRVERVQEITAEEAAAEGCYSDKAIELPGEWSVITQYRHLWDELNAKRGFGWDINPYVWVIEFKRIENSK